MLSFVQPAEASFRTLELARREPRRFDDESLLHLDRDPRLRAANDKLPSDWHSRRHLLVRLGLLLAGWRSAKTLV